MRVVRHFDAASCANGEVKVSPIWTSDPVEPDCCPEGVMTRMAVANWIERVLNEAIVDERGADLEMEDA